MRMHQLTAVNSKDVGRGYSCYGHPPIFTGLQQCRMYVKNAVVWTRAGDVEANQPW